MDARQRMLNRMPRNSRWYDIRNEAATDTATVRIYDEIGFWGVTEEDFARDLAGITANEIEVQISSPGGDVFAGIAIYNALRAHSARVTTRVDGVAASIASVISQAGDHRVMLSGSQMVVHAAWGVAIGPASELREYADILDRQTENIANIYAARSGKKAEEFVALLAEGDTWLTAEAAVEMGLADEVVDPPRQDKAKASVVVDVAASGDLLERLEQLSAQVEALNNQTSSADQREELTPEQSEVTSEQAERLLASLTMEEK